MRYLFLLVSLLIQSLLSLGQQEPELRFKKIPDELLQGVETSSFFITKDHLLWFATNKGLASFDGSELVYYKSKGLSDNNRFRVMYLVEDADNNLWMATPEHGLLFFNRHTGIFKKIELAIRDKVPATAVKPGDLFIDNEGLVWVSTAGRGFFIYDPKTNRYQHFNLQPDKPSDWESRYSNSARQIIQDKKDNNIYWIAGYGSGIYSFNKAGKTISKKFINGNKKDTLWEQRVVNLSQTTDSTIWFSTWGCGMGEYNTHTGLYHIYPRNTGYKVDLYPNGHVIEFMAAKSDSEFYVAPRDTIPAVFNIHTKRYYYINNAEFNEEIGKTQNVKTDGGIVYYQKGGSLFIGGTRFSLFNTIELTEGKKHGVYGDMRCILWDASQKKYYAGIQHGDGVNVYDADFKLQQTLPIPPYSGDGILKSASIWKLHRDKAGHLWALGHITCIYDSSKFSFVPVSSKWPQLKLMDSTFYDVAEDKKGLLYFSSFNAEFIAVDPFALTAKKLVIPANATTASFSFYNQWVLSDTMRGFIYFINRNSLYQYRIANNTFQKLYIDSSYYSNRSSQFYSSYAIDAKGNIWMITPDHYLWKIDPGSFIVTDTIKFDNSSIYLNRGQLYGYFKDHILISTAPGKYFFNTQTKEFIYLNRNNGLFLNHSTWNMACNGKVFYNYSGVIQFASIEKLIQAPNKPIPYISSILINNHPVVSDSLPQSLKTLQLHHAHNTVSISFSSVSPEFPERLEYAYKLENSDKEWSYTNNLNRRINYANLSPGEYIFKVKLREVGMDWSAEKSLLITITPPFWKRGGFIILTALLVAALLIWVIQKRIQKIRKQEKLRTLHQKELLELEAKALRAQMNPHFIFNCLNSIKSLIQEGNDDKAIEYLTTFSKLIRTIFNNSDNREITLYDELETCKLYSELEAMRFENKLHFEFRVDENIDTKSVKVPALIVQPFIENAIWHGVMLKDKGGIIKVQVHENNNAIEIVIDDNGIGRTQSIKNKSKTLNTHQSKGVHLTQSRLDLDGKLNERKAVVSIIDKTDDNNKSTGTKVLLTLTES